MLQVWLDLTMFHFALKGIDNDLGNSKINRWKIRYLKYSNGLFQKRSTLPLPSIEQMDPSPPRQESPIYTDHESQEVNMHNGYCIWARVNKHFQML